MEHRKHSKGWFSGVLLAGALVAAVNLDHTSAQVRAGRRGAVAQGKMPRWRPAPGERP